MHTKEALLGKLIRFKSTNFPTRHLRHRGFEVWLDEGDNTSLFHWDSLFKVVDGLAGQGISFESVNYPNHHIRHSGYKLYVHNYQNAQLYKEDASWNLASPFQGGTGESSFQSINFPQRFLRHAYYRARIDPQTPGAFAPDATWTIEILEGVTLTSRTIDLVAIQMSMLPDGKVFCYGSPFGNNNMPMANKQNGGDVVIFDPLSPATPLTKRTQLFTVDSFCGAAIYFRSNAGPRLCIVGGNDPMKKGTLMIDYADIINVQAYQSSQFNLKHPRWYASLVKLADNKILALGGAEPYYHNAFFTLKDLNSNKKMANTGISATPELFNGTAWEELTGAYSWPAFGRENNEWWYPRAYLAPDGKVFGVSGNRIWVLDPTVNSNTVQIVASTGGANQNESNTGVPGGYQTTQKTGKGKTDIKGSLLSGHFAGASCTSLMIEPGKILIIGGGQRGNEDMGQPGVFYNSINSITGNANALVSIIDYNGGNPLPTQAAPMTIPRNWGTAVALPNGEVAVVGGTRKYNSYKATDWVKEVEIFTTPNPKQPQGAWRTEGAISKARLYHSTAILLTDGSILIGSGGLPPAQTSPNGPSDGKYGNAATHPSFAGTPYRDVEVYQPAYLFDVNGNLAKRPIMQYQSGFSGYGSTIRVALSNLSFDETITKVSIINMPSTTHSHNNDQRYWELAFTVNSGGATMDISVPGDRNKLPPGCYMIFCVNSKGIPSEALKINNDLVEIT